MNGREKVKLTVGKKLGLGFGAVLLLIAFGAVLGFRSLPESNTICSLKSGLNRPYHPLWLKSLSFHRRPAFRQPTKGAASLFPIKIGRSSPKPSKENLSACFR